MRPLTAICTVPLMDEREAEDQPEEHPEQQPEEQADEAQQPNEDGADTDSNDGAGAVDRLRDELRKPPRPTHDDPSKAVSRPTSAYPFMPGFNAYQMMGLNRAVEDMRRAALNPLVQMQLDTIGKFPIPKWKNPVADLYLSQIEDLTRALFPRTSTLPEAMFPWLKELTATPPWMQTLDALSSGFLGSASTATSTQPRPRTNEEFLREADELLDAADDEQSDETLPADVLEAIIEDLEAALPDDLQDDATDLLDDLEESSDPSTLTPLRALTRLVVLQYPDLRDNPRLHRILRRAANGSLVATLFVVWLLNPAFFAVLMTVLGVLQTNGMGARAVDIALARGEAPRSSDETPEDSSDNEDDDEDDPQKSSDDDA